MLLNANALRIPLADASVQMICTSPPYWNLRDYSLNGRGIGLEPTLAEYLDNMRAVGREMWRVLRDDGTLWLNLGDLYWGAGGANNNSGITGRNIAEGADKDERDGPRAYSARWGKSGSLKPKDLVGLPWRVAFAFQEDGWYLRSDIIWHKPNPMPESVRDRPTKSHEYLFLLTKQPRYYYDAEAIREEGTGRGNSGGGHKWASLGNAGIENWDRPGRNRRSVWTIPTKPYKGAHFATFPPALVEPCILAGCPEGGIVLDPFCGSGTVGEVARRLGRRFVGLDLSWKYLRELAYERAEVGQLALMSPNNKRQEQA